MTIEEFRKLSAGTVVLYKGRESGIVKDSTMRVGGELRYIQWDDGCVTALAMQSTLEHVSRKVTTNG